MYSKPLLHICPKYSVNTVSSFIVQIACTQHWCQNAVHKARISYQFFNEPVWPGCYNRVIILYKSNNKWSILCCKRCVLHLIMYTVNITNFFDFGVDAGDAQLDVWVENRRQLLLSTPIQFFGTLQSELFVSHLCTLSLHAGAWLLHIFWTHFLVLSHFCHMILCKIFNKVKKKLSKILAHCLNLGSTFFKLLSINLHHFALKLVEMLKFRHIQGANYTTSA